ncbi:hypothetical protein BZG02_11655 [Labilibaculum filiforme]|uniref:Uncharacterized protein n=1 Tax=Labilibaculum filiforme TaxID=1940526 RepID=A0A2N3HXU5_9BACT|nr:hypothetical protein [Labilibaculum filiforme]PKQ62843.1 hypothetical protein BZG02_11655 [Labilibaculum filiforme]
MNGFRKFKIAIVSILLPAMMVLAGNAVFNLHVHRDSHGYVMVHAHPYQKSGSTNGTANHHHSSHECFALQQITSFLFSLTTIFFLAALIGKAFEIINIYHLRVKKEYSRSILGNRAPPAFL